MIIRSLGLGYRMAEIPSHEHKRRFGQSHISVRRCAVRYVLSFVRGLWFTRYPPLPVRGIASPRVENVLPVRR